MGQEIFNGIDIIEKVRAVALKLNNFLGDRYHLYLFIHFILCSFPKMSSPISMNEINERSINNSY